jgi:RNA polymerase sigma-70 factor (ECF subfamily)
VPNDHAAEVAEWEAICRRDEAGEAAFKDWFKRCEFPLRRSLRHFAAVVDVEAVVQETVIQIWEHDASRISRTSRPEFLLRWAIVVARNKALNIAKRTGRQDSLEAHVDLTTPAAHAPGDPFLSARIRRCLEELPPTLRRVLEARVKDDGQHSDRELAGLLDTTFAAFRQNLARGRHGVEDCLKKHGIDIRKGLQ